MNQKQDAPIEIAFLENETETVCAQCQKTVKLRAMRTTLWHDGSPICEDCARSESPNGLSFPAALLAAIDVVGPEVMQKQGDPVNWEGLTGYTLYYNNSSQKSVCPKCDGEYRSGWSIIPATLHPDGQIPCTDCYLVVS